MSTPESNPTPPARAFERLQDHWIKIENGRDAIVAELESRLPAADNQLKRTLKHLVRCLGRTIPYQDALRSPEVLVMCNALARAGSQDAPADQTLNDKEISRGVNQALSTLVRYDNFQRSLMRLMLYPILLTVITLLVGVMFSFVVARPFEEMFTEFGVRLPAATNASLWVARMTRAWIWVISIIAFVAPALIFVLGGRRSAGAWLHSDRLSEYFRSKRSRAARTAIHAKLLLEAGLSNQEATEVLSSTSQLPLGGPFQSLNVALKYPPTRAKSALLDQVALWYNGNTRNASDWWMQWAVSAYCYAMYAFVLFFVVAFFMPLISTISGLTGGS